MSILIRYDEQESLLILEVVGTPGMEEFRRIASRLVSEGIFGNVLWDLSRGKLDQISLDQLDEFIALRAECTKHTPHNYKAAVYATADAEYGLMRMLEALTPDGNTPIRIFKNKEDALAWLKG